MNAFVLIWARQNNMQVFLACVVFDKATNRCKKREMWKTLSSVSLLEFVGEKLPSLRKDQVWKSPTIFNSCDIERSVLHISCCVSVCPCVALSKAT